MTITDLFKKSAKSDIDQRGAELAARRKALESDGGELPRLELAQRAAANELAAVEAERIGHVAPLNVDTPEAAKDAAVKRLRAAREAVAKAQDDRAAFAHTTESLVERARVLRLDEEHYAHLQIIARAEDIWRRIWAALSEAQQLSDSYDALLTDAMKRWPEDESTANGEIIAKFAGLRPIMPNGLFSDAPIDIGRKSVVRDHIRSLLACTFPAALPADLLPEALERAKGIRWLADCAKWYVPFPGAPWPSPSHHATK